MAEISVPFLDLAATTASIRADLDDAYQRVMDSNWYLLGRELRSFESNFAEQVGSKYAVGVASGLDALVLALRSLDVGTGDEVIVPSHTFIATWLAVHAVGATIVPVDPDVDSCLITAEGIATAITEKTRAIIPVHLYGLPVDMPEIMELANKHGIAVIADAAQAHGATIHGEPVGNFGTICAWSFYPGKNLGAFADAGAITTNSVDLAGSIRRLRNYGSEEKYVHPDLGTNSRLDELQAAFLNVKLQYLESWNARRNDIAHTYLRELTSLDVCLPVIPAGKTSSWHLFVIRVERRDELQAHLRQCGIDTLIHYPIPNHLQDAFQYLDLYEGSFPVAEELSKHVLSIPIGPHMTNVQVDQTVSALHQFSW